MKNPVVLFRFYDTIQLHLAQSQLEQEGITTLVLDENATRTLSIFESFAIGGARLMVDRDDYHRSKQIMVEMGMMNKDAEGDFAVINWIDSFGKLMPGASKLSKELRVALTSATLITLFFLLVVLWILVNS